MSKKNKLERFAENKTFPNLFEYSYERIMAEGFPLQGKWHEDFFHNENPIVLELGCGRGEYTIGLGKQMPDKNFIGVDIKGARMWTGAKESLPNLPKWPRIRLLWNVRWQPLCKRNSHFEASGMRTSSTMRTPSCLSLGAVEASIQ